MYLPVALPISPLGKKLARVGLREALTLKSLSEQFRVAVPKVVRIPLFIRNVRHAGREYPEGAAVSSTRRIDLACQIP